MNKLGFISTIISSILLFMPFIPLGIYFGSASNPWIGFNYYNTFAVSILTYNTKQIYMWGLISSGAAMFWFEYNLITLIFLSILSIIAIITSIVGTFKGDLLGKRFMGFNFFAQLFMNLYILIGFTIYSEEIFGVAFNLVDVYLYLDYGFFILFLNLIISFIAYRKHDIKWTEYEGG
ncbi:MAG: hypothetical protein GF317_09155 [Candidatus Lokiarchaeota archaeon]|nr:hypothetical protein [Candidatus Lokiarchaeota archaeon]MBD3199878.1 hypothetical protein [Candidatus Lokiarchaeota archaeon]